MKIAIGQTNPTVGDIEGNTDRIVAMLAEAEAAGAALMVFPELSVIGYPPKDLLLKADVVDACAAAVDRIAAAAGSTAALVGYPCRAAGPHGRPLNNAVALVAEGRVVHRAVKNLLPTYDVFEETRYFEPADRAEVLDWGGARWGVSICEDLWNNPKMFDRQLYAVDPIEHLAAQGADVMVNCSASPYELGKHDFRLDLFAHLARTHGRPLIYANQVGGNDELVFDGNSCVVGADGVPIAQARAFEEDLLVVDLDEGGRQESAPTGMASVYGALVLGLRDYCRKCGFKDVVLGLSGGIDSAVAAVLAVAALGPDHVTGIAMPSRYSSAGSVDDARALAQNLGIRFAVVPIEGPHAAMESAMAPLLGDGETGLTEENIQARLRGNILMAYSNNSGAMLVTTGNKSELAVGYCTLYGDMCGGLAVISDVPKTMVYDLARWMNGVEAPFDGPPIPLDTLTKPPSAELRPDQTDQDTLPPYEVLDRIVAAYIEQHRSAAEIIAAEGFDPATVERMVRLIDRNEYKRKQAAPGLKISPRAFGVGRRMPIAQGYKPSGS